MKYFRYILLLGCWILAIIYYNKSSDFEKEQSVRYLSNNIVFEGYITGFKRSDNHAFGIIYLKITKSNIKSFNKTVNKGIYPYKIRGNVAELYCTVSIDRKKGDYLKIISNQETVYYNPSNGKEKGSIHIIADSYNIDFVRKHTMFSD